MVRRFMHFDVLYIQEYQYGEKTFHRNVKIFPFTGILLTSYQHLSSKSSHMVRNCRAGPKTFGYTRVANLGDFCLEKQIWGFFCKMFWALLDQRRTFKLLVIF
jgi:hypothetical protein